VIYRAKLANCPFMTRVKVPDVKNDAQLWTCVYTPVKQSDHEFTIFLLPASESINRFNYTRRQKDGFRLQMRDRVTVYLCETLTA